MFSWKRKNNFEFCSKLRQVMFLYLLLLFTAKQSDCLKNTWKFIIYFLWNTCSAAHWYSSTSSPCCLSSKFEAPCVYNTARWVACMTAPNMYTIEVKRSDHQQPSQIWYAAWGHFLPISLAYLAVGNSPPACPACPGLRASTFASALIRCHYKMRERAHFIGRKERSRNSHWSHDIKEAWISNPSCCLL